MTPAVRVRLITPADAAAAAAIYAPIVATTAISFEERAPDATEMERRIAALLPLYPWLVAESEDGIAGYAYASAHRARAAYRWSVDVSAYVERDARRRGVARKLYVALFRVLAAQGYYSAFAGVALPNDASLAFHRSAGFVDVGTYPNVGFKDGAWRDVHWLARELRPAASPPEEPRPLRALAASELAALLADP